MIHSYMYFNQILHFASHSLHWTNISFFIIFAHFGPPARDPYLGAPLERVPEELIFSLLLNKISWYIHTCISVRSFTLLLTHCIEQTSHSSQFFAHSGPPARDPCLGPLWGGSQRSSFFHYFWIKFHDAFIHLLQSDHSRFFSHSLHWTNISFFHNFLATSGPPARDPCLGPPWRGSQRSSFFHYFWIKFHDAFISFFQ